jgi:signal transduction histidine kinase
VDRLKSSVTSAARSKLRSPVRSLTLSQRLSLLFAVLLLACFGAAAWLQMLQSTRHAQQIEQQLLRRLAGHIAAEASAMGPLGLDAKRLASVVERLRITNPGVELYVLDPQGRVEMRYPEAAPLQRDVVNLSPLREFIAGGDTLVLGDDPLSASGSKAFSAAPYGRGTGTPGFLYAVLQGAAYDMASQHVHRRSAFQIALWSVGLVAPLGLLAGAVALALVARPLSALTHEVELLEAQGLQGRVAHGLSGARVPPGTNDEIAILRAAFSRLVDTNAAQWHRLSHQDQQRRELIANLSHDLRTPLASMHGYLETLMLKSPQLDAAEQQRLLRAALAQSQRLSQLVHELLELARLELGTLKPTIERFSLAELTLDVMQKLALAASARDQRLEPRFAVGLPDVCADIGMIERVMTNLLDNAIRHSSPGGEILVELKAEAAAVRVEVIDQGPGIAPERLATLFTRPTDGLFHAQRAAAHRHETQGPDGLPGTSQQGNGLGLAIVRQILQLHGQEIELDSSLGSGAAFLFRLPLADPDAPVSAS